MLAVRSLADSSRHLEFMSTRESHFDRQYYRALERLIRFRTQKVVFNPESQQPQENKGDTEIG
jgi:Mn-containing catalase